MVRFALTKPLAKQTEYGRLFMRLEQARVVGWAVVERQLSKSGWNMNITMPSLPTTGKNKLLEKDKVCIGNSYSGDGKDPILQVYYAPTYHLSMPTM